MGRIVKTATARQDEIIDVAQGLFAELGYTNTPVQSIIDAVGIAKGTFYHHFRSKSELLDALVMRLVDEYPPLVRPLVEDPEVGAIDKFLGFFQRANAWKVRQRALMVEIGSALRDDANVRLRYRLQGAILDVNEPILSKIIEQGVREGVFDTRFPRQTAHIVMTILESMSNAFSEALYKTGREAVSRTDLETLHDAHAEAMERVLGAPEGSLCIVDRETIGFWLEEVMEHASDNGATGRVGQHRRSS